MEQYISVTKIINAIKAFKELGNKHYDNIVIPESYADVVRTEDPEGYNFLFPEENDLLLESSEENEDMQENLDCTDEDEIYLKQDPIQRWKFNYDEKTTYVEDYPEMNVYD